jgi:hypothetical protein
VKVRGTASSQPAVRGRALIILSFSFLVLLSVFTSTAGALTRQQVLARANSWIERRIPYSQHGYHAGYRRDCSGFVSMAWSLKTSYSSRSITSQARRISRSALKPGDAVLVPGHVSLFGGWKNRARGEYIAIEQTTWGDHAKRHVQRMPSKAVALRRKGIVEPRRVAAVTASKAAVTALAAAAAASPTAISTSFTVASISAALAPEMPARPLVSIEHVRSVSAEG